MKWIGTRFSESVLVNEFLNKLHKAGVPPENIKVYGTSYQNVIVVHYLWDIEIKRD